MADKDDDEVKRRARDEREQLKKLPLVADQLVEDDQGELRPEPPGRSILDT